MTTYDKATGTSGKLRINVTITQNKAANQSTFAFSFQIVNTSSPTFTFGKGWSANAAGLANSGDFDINGAQTITLWSGSRTFTHDSNGNLSAKTFSMHMDSTGTSGLGGPTDHSVTLTAPKIAGAPGAPGTPTVDTVSDTGVTMDWTAPSNVGSSPIETYGFYIARDSGFTDYFYQAWVGNVLTKTVSGLLPGTTYYSRVRADNGDGIGPYSGTRTFTTAPGKPSGLKSSSITPNAFGLSWTAVATATGYDIQYGTSSSFSGATTTTSTSASKSISGLNPATLYYVRVRAKNASGSGAWSSTFTVTTLPSTSPSVNVAPNPTGTSATLTFIAPSGTSGVTKYTVERRKNGTTTPVTSFDTTNTSGATVNGLTPGTSYDWRVSAWFDDYQSPFSAWKTVAQPKPNTAPGDYFDGSTADINDSGGEPKLIDYGWAGTTNLSRSTATAPSVLGWQVGVPSGGGTCVLQRVLGGRHGKYAARMLMMSDASGAGKVLGMNGSSGQNAVRAAVAEGATYTGSLYVRPSKAQLLYAEMLWFDAAGLEIGGSRILGANTLVTSTTGWTRLWATGEAPAGAVSCCVRARDNTGTGWSAWLTGDYLDADDAMVNLGALRSWFSGDSSNIATEVYAWVGTANQSQSTATERADTSYDPLRDPDCTPLPTPPAPPAVPSDCIDEVGTWRRYMLAIPDYEVRLWTSAVPTLELRTSDYEERQVRIRYYPNPNDLAPGDINATRWEAEQILSYIPANTKITIDGVSERVWAEIDGASPRSADHLLYGTGGIPATWPELQCGIGYVISLDVPLLAPSGNLQTDVLLTQRMR